MKRLFKQLLGRFLLWNAIISYPSDSQPGCLEEMSGVPPNIVFTVFYEGVTLKSASDCHF